MNRKKSIQYIIFSFALGGVVLIAAMLSRGAHIHIIIPVASAIIISGPTMMVAYKGNKQKGDSDCDERETLIAEKAMSYTFYTMVFILTAYWAYDTSKSGTLLSVSSFLMFSIWIAFGISYIITRMRY